MRELCDACLKKTQSIVKYDLFIDRSRKISSSCICIDCYPKIIKHKDFILTIYTIFEKHDVMSLLEGSQK